MLIDVDKIPPYERQLLLVFNQAVERCPSLNETQKVVIEQKLQDIVHVWTSKEFV